MLATSGERAGRRRDRCGRSAQALRQRIGLKRVCARGRLLRTEEGESCTDGTPSPRSRRSPLSALAACGSDEGGGGRTAINWYVFNEPGGAYDAAVADCNEQAGGRYKINYVKLPTDANQQRELIVRRLAAKDDSIDLIGMDVIWTAEFAEAGLDPAVGGPAPRRGREGQARRARSRPCEYKGKVWAIPFTSNTQLLWYRKDKVKPPPKDFTWDEMIDDAATKGTARRGAGAPVRGPHGVDQLADRRRGRSDRRPERQREGGRQRQAGRRDHRASWPSRRPRPRACPPTRRTRRAWASSPGAPTSRSTTRSSTRAPRPWARTSRRRSAGRAIRAPRRTSPAGRRSAASTSACRRLLEEARPRLRRRAMPGPAASTRRSPRRRAACRPPRSRSTTTPKVKKALPVRRPAPRVDRGGARRGP